jgi:hypothetical protein
MEEILARRFAPFNFFAILGFPNVVPSMDEWGDYLPRFREREEDNPAQHLSEFHELMCQWEIRLCLMRAVRIEDWGRKLL